MSRKQAIALNGSGKSRSNLALACLILLLIANPIIRAQDSNNKHHILFIGNLLITVNSMPNQLKSICQDLGVAPELELTIIAKSNVELDYHLKDKDSLNTIRRGEWDTIVFQAHWLEPLSDYEKFALAAEQLSQEAKAVNARVAFFETWALQRGGTNDDILAKEWAGGDFYAMQSRLRAAFEKIARKTGGRVVPVGDAWELVVREHPEIILHSPNGLAPSGCGTYLTACVFTIFLTGEDPRKSTWVPSYRVTEKEAEILREVAYRVVSEN